jgi:hypothetical protein
LTKEIIISRQIEEGNTVPPSGYAQLYQHWPNFPPPGIFQHVFMANVTPGGLVRVMPLAIFEEKGGFEPKNDWGGTWAPISGFSHETVVEEVRDLVSHMREEKGSSLEEISPTWFVTLSRLVFKSARIEFGDVLDEEIQKVLK